MTCPICQSTETTFLQNFVPYKDKDWEFPVYDCKNCHSRFAKRDESVNYHNLIHEAGRNSTYQPHYILAEKVADYISRGEIKACERFLREDNFMHGHVLDFIESQKKKNLKVLEIGCSSGYFTAFLNAKGTETYGADISETAIKKARNLFPLYAQLFSEAPLHADYDIVFHKGVISCVNDPVSFFNSNITLLNHQGKLIFNMSNVQSTRKLGETWASTPPPDVIYLFHEQALEYFLKKQKSYKIEVTKHLDYFLLFKKYQTLFSRKSFNKYPRTFHKKNESRPTTFLVRVIVLSIGFTTKLLTKIRLLKVIEEDFGTVVKLTKQ